MSDRHMLQIDTERHAQAILDSLEALIGIAGTGDEGYRLVQKLLPDLQTASDFTGKLIALLKKRPRLRAVS